MRKTIMLIVIFAMITFIGCQKNQDIVNDDVNENSKLIIRYLIGHDVEVSKLISDEFILVKDDYQHVFENISDYTLKSSDIIDEEAYVSYLIEAEHDTTIDLLFKQNKSKWMLTDIMVFEIQEKVDSTSDNYSSENEFIEYIAKGNFASAEKLISPDFYDKNGLTDENMSFTTYMKKNLNFIKMDIETWKLLKAPSQYNQGFHEYVLNENKNNEEICLLKYEDGLVSEVYFRSLEILKKSTMFRDTVEEMDKSIEDLNFTEEILDQRFQHLIDLMDNQKYDQLYFNTSSALKRKLDSSEFERYIELLIKRYNFKSKDSFHATYEVSTDYVEDKLRIARRFSRDNQTNRFLDKDYDLMDLMILSFELDVDLNLLGVMIHFSQGYQKDRINENVFDDESSEESRNLSELIIVDEYIKALRNLDYEYLWNFEKQYSQLTKTEYIELLELESKMVGGFKGAYGPIISNEKKYIAKDYAAYEYHVEYGFVTTDAMCGNIIVFLTPDKEIIGHCINLIGDAYEK